MFNTVLQWLNLMCVGEERMMDLEQEGEGEEDFSLIAEAVMSVDGFTFEEGEEREMMM